MKKNIHPEKSSVTVVMNDGSEFKLMMKLPNNAQRLVLDIDPTTHPAWRDGERKLIDTSGQVQKFTKKFGKLF